jgi:hypothetical protein
VRYIASDLRFEELNNHHLPSKHYCWLACLWVLQNKARITETSPPLKCHPSYDSHSRINLTLGLEEMLEQETLKGTNPVTGHATYRLQTNEWNSFYCLRVQMTPLTGSLANCDYKQKTGKNNDFNN